VSFSEAELLNHLAQLFWPLLRIGAMFVAMPVLSGRLVPSRFMSGLVLVITFLVVPFLPPPAAVELFSYEGFLLAGQQIFIGLMSGFVLQLVFAALIFSGQSTAFSMGLGFASMVDPTSGVQVPVVSQFYLIFGSLIFLLLDGHLLLIEMMVDSFTTIPVALDGISRNTIMDLVLWSSRLFVGGLLMSLPVVGTLLLVNMGFGVASRAAPQLNIFSVGFPVTLLLGLLIMWVTLPAVLNQFSGLLSEGYLVLGRMLLIRS
jgi:flagellar biosynthetic protein FliR